MELSYSQTRIIIMSGFLSVLFCCVFCFVLFWFCLVWVRLRISFKICDKHPHHCYMAVPLVDCLQSAFSLEVHRVFNPKQARSQKVAVKRK